MAEQATPPVPSNRSEGVHDLNVNDLNARLVHASIASADDGINPWADNPTVPEETMRVAESASHSLALEVGAAPQSTLPKLDRNAFGPDANSEVLDEFDPLIGAKEKEAQLDVREGSELSTGHLMHIEAGTDATTSLVSVPSPVPAPIVAPARRDSLPRTPVRSSSPSSSASPSAVLSSFASSLAKTFTLPRPRPRSMEDSHASVLSPTSIQSFAKQQGSSSSPSRSQVMRSAVTERCIERDEGSHASDRETSDCKTSDEPPPFDFQRFLDQMKSRSSEPVGKYLRSFLSNFAKRSFPINDQVKLISDFLNFISLRMRECDIWRNVSDEEFDNAMEGMEKLVMNRLYDFTFTPQLAEADPPRPVTTDDLERDKILGQRIALFGWVEERHFDVPEGPDSRGFLMFAQQELLKINHYKAPRDKLICVLNCCKVIFGLLRHLHKEENADSFVPILIYATLKANPPHMISNIEYIQRFRSPKKLQGEAGYYLSSLMGAVQFIETLDHSGLSNITAEEFERNVEDAIYNLPTSPSPEKPAQATSSPETQTSASSLPATPGRQRISSPTPQTLEPSIPVSPHAGEESAQPLHLSLVDLGSGTNSLADDTRRFLQRTGDTLSKPLNALGRILGEALDGLDGSNSPSTPPGRQGPRPFGSLAPYEIARDQSQGLNVPEPRTPTWANRAGPDNGGHPPPIQTPYKPRVRHFASLSTPSTPVSGRSTPEGTPSRSNLPLASHSTFPSLSSIPSHLVPGVFKSVDPESSISRTATPVLDISGMQAEIDRAHDRAASAALGTLTQIFPNIDNDIIKWVLEAEGGDLGQSIEKLLEIVGSS